MLVERRVFRPVWTDPCVTSVTTSSTLWHRFRGLFGPHGTAAGLGDADLVARFAATGDPTAFEALVSRHGPMVWALCRRTLRDSTDAEDAFQATFLVLVRKARSVRDPDRLGPWLYGVAYRVAVRARQDRDRRQRREQSDADGQTLADASAPAQEPNDDHEHARRHLDAALVGMPRIYRDVIVLCDLEGRTHEQAAQQLHCPLGTVKGRHHRARARLRKRLLAQGLSSLAMPALVALLTADEAAAAAGATTALPPGLLSSTLQAAASFGATAAASGSLPPLTAAAPAAALAEGVLSAMFWKPIGLVAATLLTTAGIAASGALLVAADGQKPGENAPTAPAVATSDADDGADPPEIREARKKLAEAEEAVLVWPFEEILRSLDEPPPSTAPTDLIELEANFASIDIMVQKMRKDPNLRAHPLPALEAHASRMKRLAALDHEIMNRREASQHSSKSSGPAAATPQRILCPPQADLHLAAAELWVAEARAGREPTGLHQMLSQHDPELFPWPRPDRPIAPETSRSPLDLGKAPPPPPVAPSRSQPADVPRQIEPAPSADSSEIRKTP
jgi:RNA polymerase sigma factor (sigma-70 family)